jgi:mycofactocin system glycosyltransferase
VTRRAAAGCPTGTEPGGGAEDTVELDPGARLHEGSAGGLLVGGQPLRVLRLSAAGAAAVGRWRSGPVPVGPAERALAARLHEAGLAVLRPAGSPFTRADITVVVPVRDRSRELDRCLAGIGDCADVVVVDDGSRDPAAVAAVVARHRARLLTRPHGGPAAARNTGLAEARTALVAFVDSDCRLPTGWLDGLLPALGTGAAVVAPRVVGSGGRAATERFETTCGPLDLGDAAGPVGPGRRVGHVPAAVLLCRRDVLGAGFDETMPVGEDVDLVWRLAAAGEAVRYEPRVVVRHDTRADLASWLRQRAGYGRSAALLDARYPGRVAPVVLSRWTLPTVACLAAGRPVAAAGCTALGAVVLWSKLPAGPGRAAETARLSALGLGWTLLGLTDAVARPWLPVLLPLAAASPAARRITAASVALRLVRARRRRPSDLGVAHWAALRMADDLAYGAGLWVGVLADRRPRAVLPRLD